MATRGISVPAAGHAKPWSRKAEPIAIIGIGCRLPGGVTSPEEFWNLLRDGIDAVGEVPHDRWRVQDAPSPKDRALHCGGFLDDLDKFDARFFGITPREATLMDPQQRLLLEVAWEALEDSGIVPIDIAGSNASVFVGISTQDYGMLEAAVMDRSSIGAYTNSGVGMCIAANRISYLLDLHGPSVAVDTACSSALVAVHLACQSIWNENCSLALAGGVNALLRLESSIGFHRASMLSPDGRCKSFDAKANGYVRSEGAGIVVLRPLSLALAAKESIYALIRATSVNQSGHGAGITVPSAAAQELLLRQAFRCARIRLSDVDYIEAHGTGTPVGDPIEAQAIGRALGRSRRRGRHCLVGSVKSNIGHLEAASGIAGLMKAALCVEKGLIPPSLHFSSPNPNVAFDRLHLRVPRKLEPWPDTEGRPRIAGVNSFGFGGVNAHVVLEQPPPQASSSSNGRVAANKEFLLPLSARSPEALVAIAKSHLQASPNHDLSSLCYSAAARRGHHDHRLALVIRSKEEFADCINAFLNGERHPRMSSGRKLPGRSPQIAFVLGGMGPQKPGMGLGLLHEPEFRRSLEACDRLLRKHVRWSLLEELTRPEESSRIHETCIAQPAIFAVQVALAALWGSWGVEPAAIVGHSVGEVAAAHVAGVLSLEDAIAVIFHRSRLQHRTEGQGTLLAVALPLAAAQARIGPHNGSVSIAAINSPSTVTLSGDVVALEEIANSLEADHVFCRFLDAMVPYHSARMDPLMPELRHSLRGIQPSAASIPLFSTVTGHQVSGTELNGDYWAENIRRPVRFFDAFGKVIEAGCGVFVEISPHPVLAGSISDCLGEACRSTTVLPSLRHRESELGTMLRALGALYTLGCTIEWKRLYSSGGFVRLPRYPWQRERFWFESEEERQRRLDHGAHPLLGARLKSATPIWGSEINRLHAHSYLDDHRIQGAVVYPGAAYVEMALAAAREAFADGAYVLEEIEFIRLCLLPDTPLKFQLVLDSAQSSFDIFSFTDKAKASWTRNATGKLRRVQQGDTRFGEPLGTIRSRCKDEINKDDYYCRCARVGLEYGTAFQRIEHIWRGEKEALARLGLTVPNDAADGFYLVHPAVLDACFQSVLGVVCEHGRDDFGFLGLPVHIDQVRFYATPPPACWVHTRLLAFSEASLKADLTVMDEEARVCIEVRGLTCQSLSGASTRPRTGIEHHLYASQWELKPRRGNQEPRPPADYLPRPGEIIKQLEPEVGRLRMDVARKRYEAMLEPQLRHWAITYSLKALEDLGWDFDCRRRLSFSTLCSELPILPEYHRFVRRMLEMLGEEGILAKTGEEWEVRDLPDLHNIHEVERSSWLQISAYLVECILLRRCGERLADVLRGKVDPLEIIFPQGSFAYAQHLYQDSPTYRPYNFLVGRALAAALRNLPPGRSARILEVGGGIGGMTSYILPLLRSKEAEYVFTDVSGVFVAQARQTFSDYPFIEYKILDVEADPLSQGFDAHSFDIIVASDVLHATPNLRESVEHLKTLLASNGLLILLEGTNMTYLPIMVFGLLKSWWRFRDERVEKLDPRISPEAWRRLLFDKGFVSVDCVSGLAEGSEAAHSIILAQGPTCTAVAAPPTPQPHDFGKPGRWLIAADSGGIGRRLARRLEERGQQPVLVYRAAQFKHRSATEFRVRTGHPEDWERIIQAGDLPWRGVVHLWSLDIPEPKESTLTGFDVARQRGCLSVCDLVQAVVKHSFGEPPRIWLATRGAQPVTADQASVSISQAPLWGFGRVIMNEHPSLRCTLIDLDPKEHRKIDWLVHELSAAGSENEIALRGAARYVHRFNRSSFSGFAPEVKYDSNRTDAALQIEMATPGILESARARITTRVKPEPHEVEIEIHAAGLNFKDLMVAMGALPITAFEAGYTGPCLGIECAGVVTAVGENVSELAVGEEVLACAPATLATHTRVDARFVVRKPPQLTFEEAAGIPVAFSTAYYALCQLGRLQKSERILIHAATGGVGLAAVQLAQCMGAEIFATAGTSDKRDFLRAIGVRYVSDSRALDFADEIMNWTGGCGVDLVLNSLAGEAIAKSVSVLAPYGRFIEIGKYDIYANSKIGLRPFASNLSYFAVDVDRLMRERPDQAATIAREVMQYFTAGQLCPLPHRVFPANRVGSAFRYMAQAKHIGKIIVSLRDVRDLNVVPAHRTTTPVSFRSDGTYLVTGGLRGFGLATARWIVERGARHIVLVGRSGPSSSEAVEVLETMRAQGVNVKVARADVSLEGDVRAVLAEMEGSMPPLRGVFHAAMVLEDTLLTGLNDQRIAKVMAPKIAGAWNLHVLTSGAPLDYFVLFSSMSSLFGTPSQGNYAAANSFLDALAWHRRTRGLPACAVNWGVVADAGHVARHPEVARVLETQLGATGTTADELLQALGQLLQVGAIQPSIVKLDWQHVANAMQTVRTAPRFANVLAEVGSASVRESGRSIMAALMAALPEEREQLLAAHVLKEIGLIMGTSASSLDLDQPMIHLGIDSLMAVELKNRVELDFGIQLNATQFLGGLTLGGMIQMLYEHTTKMLPTNATALPVGQTPQSAAPQASLSPENAQVEPEQTVPNANIVEDDPMANVDQLSDEQVDTLLRSAVRG